MKGIKRISKPENMYITNVLYKFCASNQLDDIHIEACNDKVCVSRRYYSRYYAIRVTFDRLSSFRVP